MHGNTRPQDPASLARRGCPQQPAWLPSLAQGSWATPGNGLEVSEPPFFDTNRLTLAGLHQPDVAFSASQCGVAHPPKVCLRSALRLPQKPPHPDHQRALSITKTSKDGQVPRLTSNWKPGGTLLRIHTGGPTGRVVCTGTRFHSAMPGSAQRHCDVTPGAEKGTAHLPCYQNNTLADNCWTAFKQFCLHTSKNARHYAFYSPGEQHLPGPAQPLSNLRHRAPLPLGTTPLDAGPEAGTWPGHPINPRVSPKAVLANMTPLHGQKG